MQPCFARIQLSCKRHATIVVNSDIFPVHLLLIGIEEIEQDCKFSSVVVRLNLLQEMEVGWTELVSMNPNKKQIFSGTQG